MPATPTTASARPFDARPTEHEPVVHELVGVFLAMAGLLFGSALVTLAPEGSTRPFANVAGSVGRFLAGRSTMVLGAGAFLFAAFPIAWGIACIQGRWPRAWVRKALLVPVLAALVGVLFSLLFHRLAIPGLYRYGPGGYFGIAVGHSLFAVLGKAASLVVAALATAVLLLSTDIRLKTLFARLAAPKSEGAMATQDRDDVGGGGTAVADPDTAEDDPVSADVPELDAVPAPAEDLFGPGHGAALAPPRPPRIPKTRPPRPRPKRSSGAYEFPPTTLLEPGEAVDHSRVAVEIERNAAVLGATLRSFGIEARVVSQRRGPVITFYELELEAGTRLNRITMLDKDLAIALKAESVRIVAPIPGKNTVGVEVPNVLRDSVRLLDLIDEAGERTGKRAIPLFLGKDGMGEPIIEDLAEMPHMLIAGATGSGKSVCVNSILLSVLLTRTPEEVKFVLMDPKQVELSFFEGIPHLLTPVVTNMKKASQILEWAVSKMEQRYDLFLKCGVRNIAAYNAQGAERIAALRAEHQFDPADMPELMPYLVMVVDELADLMLQHGKDVETAIIRLAAKSRAVGIHLILATQRPSVDVITGLIKSNMPMRMSFKVSSMIDSRVILDHKGAEKLLGRGDMLYIPPRSSNLKRAQGTYISDAEVKAVVDFVKEKAGPAEYTDILNETAEGLGDPNEEDELYDDAVRAVLLTKLGSASMLQRKFGIGYTRASRLIDMMCDHKVVGPHKGSKARELLVTYDEWEATHAAAKALPAAPRRDEVEPDGPMGDSPEDDGVSDKGASKDGRGVGSPWD